VLAFGDSGEDAQLLTPSPVDRITLREAGELAARMHRTTTTNEDAAKLGNTLRRTLRRVGLDEPEPLSLKPRPPTPLDDDLQAMHMLHSIRAEATK
jgi:hypothetical protein